MSRRDPSLHRGSVHSCPLALHGHACSSTPAGGWPNPLGSLFCFCFCFCFVSLNFDNHSSRLHAICTIVLLIITCLIPHRRMSWCARSSSNGSLPTAGPPHRPRRPSPLHSRTTRRALGAHRSWQQGWMASLARTLRLHQRTLIATCCLVRSSVCLPHPTATPTPLAAHTHTSTHPSHKSPIRHRCSTSQRCPPVCRRAH